MELCALPKVQTEETTMEPQAVAQHKGDEVVVFEERICEFKVEKKKEKKQRGDCANCPNFDPKGVVNCEICNCLQPSFRQYRKYTIFKVVKRSFRNCFRFKTEVGGGVTLPEGRCEGAKQQSHDLDRPATRIHNPISFTLAPKRYGMGLK